MLKELWPKFSLLKHSTVHLTGTSPVNGLVILSMAQNREHDREMANALSILHGLMRE